ncbi:hybrid sensor histidine kinase/response regulator [Pseudocolwellia agarivorans]|uniref:hybrid sensor histidine kinase/response regulator n=1 Tax=Pseudocolwellia agarivorans TaxID=1911682 RepID=UPI0009879DB9|nr:hybrid sensor histidine kinase/response regulator [Pseudocolwellia agarivorans]
MKVLIIEDNPDHRELIEDALHLIKDVRVKISSAATAESGKSMLLNRNYDACLCDLQLPDSTIEETIEWLGSQRFSTPIIILTSLNNLQIAKDLLNQGIQDYIPKNEISPQLLYRTCRYAIDRWRHQQVIEEHNKDMKAFCASLSHDFNGQINHIKLISDILKTDLEARVTLTPDEKNWFKYLNTSTTAIHELVYSLQQYLLVGSTKRVFELVNLADVVNEVVELLKESVDKDFTLNIKTPLPTIKGNAGLLHLLFQNLIGNSIKFNENVPEIFLSSKENGRIVSIYIQDNGIGFDVEKTKEIFTPFKRLADKSKYPGSGIGLSIVKQVIDHHRGSIQVESEIGVGSCFILNFLKEN